MERSEIEAEAKKLKQLIQAACEDFFASTGGEYIPDIELRSLETTSIESSKRTYRVNVDVTVQEEPIRV